MKQNSPLNYFFGYNENNIQIQIWCALIGLMLLQVLFNKNKAQMALSILASFVSLQLMNDIGSAAFIEKYKLKSIRAKTDTPLKKKHKEKTPLCYQAIINF